MDSDITALRAQDVYSGLQTVDQTSGIIAAELEVTRVTGMAATVAANIKGIDVITDPKALKIIASQQWGIDSLALPHVLRVLEEVGYVTQRNDTRGNVAQIDEHIPLLHDDLYDRLGQHFDASSPTELDRAAVNSLEDLATAPIRMSELEAKIGDQDTISHLLEIGEAAQFCQRLQLSDGDSIIWSPYCAYEKPEALDQIFSAFEDETIRKQFDRVKTYQGLPLTGDATVLEQAVGQGVLLSNSINGSGGEASFAFLPYRAGPAYRRMEKIILEKALILLACVRYGQHYARHPIHYPAAILRKLSDSAGLSATTEAPSQYRTAAQAQIVRLEDAGGGYFSARLNDTPDNLLAAKLAIDLLEHGEPITSRDDSDQKLLFTGGKYLTPLMTMKSHTPKVKLSGDLIASLRDTIGGEHRG